MKLVGYETVRYYRMVKSGEIRIGRYRTKTLTPMHDRLHADKKTIAAETCKVEHDADLSADTGGMCGTFLDPVKTTGDLRAANRAWHKQRKAVRA